MRKWISLLFALLIGITLVVYLFAQAKGEPVSEGERLFHLIQMGMPLSEVQDVLGKPTRKEYVVASIVREPPSGVIWEKDEFTVYVGLDEQGCVKEKGLLTKDGQPMWDRGLPDGSVHFYSERVQQWMGLKPREITAKDLIKGSCSQ
jgi:hypothetical protein